MYRKFLMIVVIVLSGFMLVAQPNRWQQRVKYEMDIDVDVTTNRYSGKQKLEYTNNSPDTLDKLFYHLYWNAFQPNSMMDTRSRELGKTRVGNRPDWDARVRDRILNLKENEIGYQKIKWLKLNGVLQKTIEHETILEVQLSKPILPKQKVILEMEWDAQVPLQVRRSGRDAANGVKLSMAQWYPKLCEFDFEGWNTSPYLGREFHGVWGNYDVTLSLDKSYMVAATGVLQNPNAVADKFGNLSWNFTGKNIHDFMWAADNKYKHLSKEVRKGLTLHVYFKEKNASSDSAWANILWAAEKVLPYMEKKYGAYPYPQYSFIQGGDGGMEYGMGTLLQGPGLGTAIHEWMHTWYQHILGTNESLFPWMDEGFTTFINSFSSKEFKSTPGK